MCDSLVVALAKKLKHYVHNVFLLNNHEAISNCFSNNQLFKRDESFNYTVKFLSTLSALNHLSSEVYETSTAMESESQPTISLILPFLFNFTKKLESAEKDNVAVQSETLCKKYFSSVEMKDVKAVVNVVFDTFKEAFIDFKVKYLESKFYDKLALSTLLDPRYKPGKTFSESEKIRLATKVYVLMSEESSCQTESTNEEPSGNCIESSLPDNLQATTTKNPDSERNVGAQADSNIGYDDPLIDDLQRLLSSDSEFEYTSDEDESLPVEPVTKRLRVEKDIIALCSTKVKRGLAFDSESESEPEDEFQGLKKEYETFVSTKFRSDDVWEWFRQH